MFIAALFTIAKLGKQPKFPSIDNWIKSCSMYVCMYVCTYIYPYIYTYIIKPLKNEIVPFVPTWMDLQSIMLSEISQRKKYHLISLYVESKEQNK